MFDLIRPSKTPVAIEPAHLSLAFSPSVGSPHATKTIRTGPQIQVERQPTLHSVVSEFGVPGTTISADSQRWALDHFVPLRDARAITCEQLASDALVLVAVGHADQALTLLGACEPERRDFWSVYAFSRALFILKRFDEAERALRDVSETLHEDPRPLHALGKMLLERGHFRNAADILAQAGTKPNASYEVWVDHAAALIALDNSNDAIRLLRRALQKNANCATALNNMGVSYAKRGNNERAMKYFAEALTVQPSFIPARNNFAEILISSESYERALDILDDVTDSGSVHLRAWCHLKLGKTERARKLLTLAAESTPDAFLWNNLGVTQVASGMAADAEASFYRAAESAPDNIDFASNLGTLLLANGKPDIASDLLSRWKDDLRKTSADFANLLATALLSAERVDDAIRVLREGVLHFPDDDALWANLGYVYSSRRDRPDLAIEVLRSAVTRIPNSLRIRNNLAYALLKTGCVDEANTVLQPTQPALQDRVRDAMHVCLLATWGLLFIRLGRFAEGKAHYENALAMAPTDALRNRVKQKLLVEEAIFQIGRGNQSKAYDLLRRAVKLNADVEFTEEAQSRLTNAYRQ